VKGQGVDLGLKDATAVVVGGGRGMGFAAARSLADDGARVALVGRTAEGLTEWGSPDAVGPATRGTFDATSDRHPARLHGRKGGPDEHLQEPFVADANINVDGGSDFT
jgi:3-oxoacyl-[acyl-carrier protein] reductase